MTIKIGAKWWGLSAARLYDFATGGFTQRDPVPSLIKVVSAAEGNTLGCFGPTSFAKTVIDEIVKVQTEPQSFVKWYMNFYRAWSGNPTREVDATGLWIVDGGASSYGVAPKPRPTRSVVICYDPSVWGACGAAKTYQLSLRVYNIDVVMVPGDRPISVINKRPNNMVGLILIGHGLANHSNQFDRDLLMLLRPSGGYQLLMMQSCFSYQLANPGGYIDEASDLMAKEGLLVTNYRYSSVIGQVDNFDARIWQWASNPATAGDLQAGKYRLAVDYTFPVDLVETLVNGANYGVWGGGAKSPKDPKCGCK